MYFLLLQNNLFGNEKNNLILGTDKISTFQKIIKNFPERAKMLTNGQCNLIVSHFPKIFSYFQKTLYERL